jgi:hypothetical protein
MVFGAVILLLATLACGSNPTAATSPADQTGIETVVASTLAALTATAPTVTQEVSPTEAAATQDSSGQLTPDGTAVNTAEISFFIPNGIANDATSAMTSDTEYPYSNPSGGDMPQHVKLTLNLYALSDTTYQPQIILFRSAEYAQYSDLTAGIVTALQSLQYVDGQPLPENLDGALFTAQVHAINFKNGHGIRLLTQTGQSPGPVNNKDLLYYFQGITNDGQYYIEATLPINAPFLSADFDINSPLPADGIPFNMDDFGGYFDAVAQKLNETDTFSYTPYLEYLDAMMESIQVTGY